MNGWNFNHGLGDTANFARMLLMPSLAENRLVNTSHDKQWLFDELGFASGNHGDCEHHGWWLSGKSVNAKTHWHGNKPGENLQHFRNIPDGVTIDALWNEAKSVNRVLSPRFDRIEAVVDGWRETFPHVILWHTMGNTSSEWKSYPWELQRETLRGFLNETEALVVVLDWDSRAYWTRNHRVKNMAEEFGRVEIPELLCLMNHSDLVVGIDSGPFYLAQFSETPALGVFFENHHPSEYVIPWDSGLCLVDSGNRARPLNASKRFEFNLIESPNEKLTARDIVGTVSGMLDCDGMTTQVFHLRHVIESKLQGSGELSDVFDRNVTMKMAIDHLRSIPVRDFSIVETGCMRADEDWSGAGMSTAIFSRYVQKLDSLEFNGEFVSFDTDKRNVDFANDYCRQFSLPDGNSRSKVVQSRGDLGLKWWTGKPIGLLYLDSLDTGDPNHQDVNLEEFKAAEPHLYEGAMVIIDDTPTMNIGKGCKTIRYALERGWRIKWAGYQVVLTRS